MKRILITEYEDGWELILPDGETVRRRDALEVANHAAEYGESLRGTSYGYIIKIRVGLLLVTLKAKIF